MTDAPRKRTSLQSRPGQTQPDQPAGSGGFPGSNLASSALGSSFIKSQICSGCASSGTDIWAIYPAWKQGELSWWKTAASKREVQLHGELRNESRMVESHFGKETLGNISAEKPYGSPFISSSCHSGVPEKGAVQLAQ